MSPFSKTHIRKVQAGFSLLEVMVAFVVMGLVVGVILQLFGSSMRSAVLADEYSFAVQVAESRMAAVGREIPVEEGEVSGDEAGSDYHWTVRMEPLELKDLGEKLEDMPVPVHLYHVDVTVNWNSDGVNRGFSLSSLRFGAES